MPANNPDRSNAKTKRAATQPEALPLDQTVLLGTRMTPDGNMALLRLPMGRVRRVRAGDRIDGARITAIEDGMLRLTRGGETRALRIPGN